MWPDRALNSGPLTYESGALPTALSRQALRVLERFCYFVLQLFVTDIVFPSVDLIEDYYIYTCSIILIFQMLFLVYDITNERSLQNITARISYINYVSISYYV